MKEQRGALEGFIEVLLTKILINTLGRNKIWTRNRNWALSIVSTAKSPHADLTYPDEMADTRKRRQDDEEQFVILQERIYTVETKVRILEAICRE